MTPRQHLKSVTDDFQQPAADVIHGFAQDGYSAKATADILEIPETTFRRILDLRDWWPWFRDNAGTNCKNFQDAVRQRPVTEKWRESNRKNAKLAGAARAHQIEYRGVTGSLKEHAERLGLKYKTVTTRFRAKPDDLDYVFSQSSHILRPGDKQCQTRNV